MKEESLGGHAFAIIGYDSRGFWVQNSWGGSWGLRGRALWTYEDWQENITDAWVLRLALPTPQIWHMPIEGGSDAGRTEGLFDRTPNRAEIAGHFVHIDDGEFHDGGRYWSNAEDVKETASLLADSDNYDHLLLYAHGGLNSVTASARRIAAMKRTFKANGIYPYHFMYDTGLGEELKDVVLGRRAEVEARAGGFTDWTDRLIEKIAQPAGRTLWREMKFGAESPFFDGGAGRAVLDVLLTAIESANKLLRIHLAGHSTGAILHAHLVEALAALDSKIRIASVSLMAPAGTVQLFRDIYRPLLKAPKSKTGINRMDIYNLNENFELDDSVAGAYRKSLLYLVSRSFEENRLPVGILGMKKYNAGLGTGLRNLRFEYSDGSGSKTTASESHAGFDNDPATMNSILKRILGRNPKHPFTRQSLRY